MHFSPTRLTQEFIQKSKLILTDFCSCNNQTWVLVNRVRQRLGAVQANPDLLGYKVRPHEAGKTAEQLFEESLRKVSHGGNSSVRGTSTEILPGTGPWESPPACPS